jgi:DNA-binding CsgD family transcriptional regulator
VERSTLDIIIGREDELAEIERVLESVASSGSSVLVIEGEPGIGKTSLGAGALAAARERGFETLTARAVEAEAGLSLAAIGDLLEPVLDAVLPTLPAPQAQALRVALLLEADTAAPDPRVLGVAVLGALRALAAGSPVLVLIDDVQWLDASSAAVLGFAARRLDREPVAFVCTKRRDHHDVLLSGLENVRPLAVGGLSAGALHRVVRERLELVLTRPALRQLHELSAGNPYYALELGRAFQRGSIRLERGEPLPPTLEALVDEQLASLPEETREALALAAAVPRPTTAVGLDVLAPAIEANVVAVEGEDVRFTHPLLAAAAYAALDADRRRELHRRLAADATDIEERARHLALASEGPDEAVAATLEEASARSRSRGAVAAAADLADRAVALTSRDDEVARHRRTLLAARCRFDAGDAGGARQQLEQLAEDRPSGLRRAEVLRELARVHMVEGTRRTAVALLRAALGEAGDDERLRATIVERLVNTLVLLREDLREASELAQRSVDAGERLDDPYILARALSALGFLGGIVGDVQAAADFERAVRLESEAGHFYGMERPTFNYAAVHMYRDDLERARRVFLDVYQEAEETGDEGSLAWTADNLAQIAFYADDWTEALRWADEADEIGAQTGQPGQQAYAKAVKALVHAHRGDAAATRELADAALELSRDEIGVGWMHARWALGALELSLGDSAAAHEQLGPTCAHVEREGIGEPGTTRFVFDDVEALVGLGTVAEAERRLDVVEGHARRLGRTFALAASARCRGLLAMAAGETDAAVGFFEQALAEHRHAGGAFQEARTLLALGGALRRGKRKREAREALGKAKLTFERLGASVWAERAREEAARVGGRAPADGELTPTERTVAELVAQGLSNRDVAAALFVTPKTVEFHLGNVFRKLGVRSRAELARRMN